MQVRDRLIVALDRSSRGDILQLADMLHGAVGVYKVGLQAFIANGPGMVRELVSRGCRIFLDLKLHDIPNTVENSVAEAASLGVSMITLHTAGGRAMMASAARAARAGNRKVTLLGVTVLTSLAETDLAQVGFAASTDAVVRNLARLAEDSGLDGVVASPHEIATIREACGSEFLVVTPGIRGKRDAKDDQKRTMSAKEALSAGASYIVVGRPITEARDPRAAAAAIIESASK